MAAPGQKRPKTTQHAQVNFRCLTHPSPPFALKLSASFSNPLVDKPLRRAATAPVSTAVLSPETFTTQPR